MAYVITDNCLKDELCVDVCPPTAFIPRRTSRNLRPRPRCMSTRRAASIAEPACPRAARTQSSWPMKSRKTRKSTSRRTPPITRSRRGPRKPSREEREKQRYGSAVSQCPRSRQRYRTNVYRSSIRLWEGDAAVRRLGSAHPDVVFTDGREYPQQMGNA